MRRPTQRALLHALPRLLLGRMSLRGVVGLATVLASIGLWTEVAPSHAGSFCALVGDPSSCDGLRRSRDGRLVSQVLRWTLFKLTNQPH